MTNQTKKKYETVITPEFRVSYPALFQPQLPMGETDEKKAKYGITMLFPAGADLSGMKALALGAATEKWGPDQTKWPKFAHPVFRSGGETGKKDIPGYGPGVIFCQAKSSAFNRKTGQKMMAPGVIGPDKQIIMDPSEIYGGCYAIAKINAFAYDTGVNKGISFGLISVMKMRDGEPFGRKSSPETDFDSITPPPATNAAGVSQPAKTESAPDNGLGM